MNHFAGPQGDRHVPPDHPTSLHTRRHRRRHCLQYGGVQGHHLSGPCCFHDQPGEVASLCLVKLEVDCIKLASVIWFFHLLLSAIGIPSSGTQWVVFIGMDDTVLPPLRIQIHAGWGGALVYSTLQSAVETEHMS